MGIRSNGPKLRITEPKTWTKDTWTNEAQKNKHLDYWILYMKFLIALLVCLEIALFS